MARFQVNRMIRSSRPRIVVDGGLRQGAHRFRLVVVDSSGNRSRPAILTVRVIRPDPGRPFPGRPGGGRPVGGRPVIGQPIVRR